MMRSRVVVFNVLCMVAAGCAPGALVLKDRSGPDGKPMGLVAFKESNNVQDWGIRDDSGKVLIPPRYNAVDEALSPEFGALVVHSWWSAHEVWKGFKNAQKDWKLREVECTFSCQDMTGLVDARGREIVPAEYATLKRVGPYLIVTKHDYVAPWGRRAGLRDLATGRELVACKYPLDDFGLDPFDKTVAGGDLTKLRLGPGETDIVLVDAQGKVKAQNLKDAVYSEFEQDWIVTRKDGSTQLLKGGSNAELADVAALVVTIGEPFIPYQSRGGKWGFLRLFKNFAEYNQPGEASPYSFGQNRIVGPAIFDKVGGCGNHIFSAHAVYAGDRQGMFIAGKIGPMRTPSEHARYLAVREKDAAEANAAANREAEWRHNHPAQQPTSAFVRSLVEGGKAGVERASGPNAYRAAPSSQSSAPGPNTTMSGEAMSKEAIRSRDAQLDRAEQLRKVDADRKDP